MIDLIEFIYDAKYGEILPVWDRTPLVIIIQDLKDGFIGLNLHYIPNINNREFFYNTLSESSKLNWNRIKHLPGSKTAIHRYLYVGVKDIIKSDDPEKSLKTQGTWAYGKK